MCLGVPHYNRNSIKPVAAKIWRVVHNADWFLLVLVTIFPVCNRTNQAGFAFAHAPTKPQIAPRRKWHNDVNGHSGAFKVKPYRAYCACFMALSRAGARSLKRLNNLI